MEVTKLELWCEAWWRDHGFKVVGADRQLAYTDYLVITPGGSYHQYRVGLVIPSRMDAYKKEFAEKWEAAK